MCAFKSCSREFVSLRLHHCHECSKDSSYKDTVFLIDEQKLLLSYQLGNINISIFLMLMELEEPFYHASWFEQSSFITLTPEPEKPIWRETGWAIMWWLPQVSIRGPLAHQAHEPAGQATVCRCNGHRFGAHIGVPEMTQSHLMHFLSSIL